ncbi:MAG: hypothetical protein HY556_07200 [Euryarchaeota archaeon]|nr:hypothetical protein [Euryarchaeota archaeon]
MAPEGTFYALIVLASLGFLNALYFTLVTYRRIAPDSRIVPKFCRMDGRTCASVVDSRYARLFGLPNSVYGMGWYLLAGGAAVIGLVTGALPYCLEMTAVSIVTVWVSVFLWWSLRYRLKVFCALCFFGQAVNVVLLGMIVAAC